MSGLLTSARWRELADDLPGAPGTARQLVARYLELLPGRTRALGRAVEVGDAGTARTVALSLQVASSMVGAGLLADRCRAVERHVGARGCDQDAVRAVEAVGEAADATGRALEVLLRRCDELVAHAPHRLDPAR